MVPASWEARGDTDDEDADQASSATASERMTDEENDTDSDEQATRKQSAKLELHGRETYDIDLRTGHTAMTYGFGLFYIYSVQHTLTCLMFLPSSLLTMK